MVILALVELNKFVELGGCVIYVGGSGRCLRCVGGLWVLWCDWLGRGLVVAGFAHAVWVKLSLGGTCDVDGTCRLDWGICGFDLGGGCGCVHGVPTL